MAAMTRKKHYVAVYERDPEGDAWLVHIKGISGCHTYGRTLRQAEERIREALAVWLGQEPDRLEITSDWPRELVKIAAEVADAREAATASVERAGAATISAAKQLERMGLSRRDAAAVLGISHQRVQQLLVRE
jgi:predicted RNase H-like HicB family nuclease